MDTNPEKMQVYADTGLTHALKCKEDNCQVESCEPLKKIVLHIQYVAKFKHPEGERSGIGSCSICLEYFEIVKLHAKTCKSPDCAIFQCKMFRPSGLRKKLMKKGSNNISTSSRGSSENGSTASTGKPSEASFSGLEPILDVPSVVADLDPITTPKSIGARSSSFLAVDITDVDSDGSGSFVSVLGSSIGAKPEDERPLSVKDELKKTGSILAMTSPKGTNKAKSSFMDSTEHDANKDLKKSSSFIEVRPTSSSKSLKSVSSFIAVSQDGMKQVPVLNSAETFTEEKDEHPDQVENPMYAENEVMGEFPKKTKSKGLFSWFKQ